MVAVVIIGGLFYYSLQNKLTKTTPQQVTFPTPNIPIEETANWDTYVNNSYGISFKYPDRFKFKDYTTSSNDYFIVLSNQKQYEFPSVLRNGEMYISFQLDKKGAHQINTVDSYEWTMSKLKVLNTLKPGESTAYDFDRFLTKKDDIDLDGVGGVSYWDEETKKERETPPGGIPYKSFHVSLINEGISCNIEAFAEYENGVYTISDENMSTFLQILSTLKFSNMSINSN